MRLLPLAAPLLCLAATAAAARAPKPVPVTVGGDVTADACALGKVIGLDPAPVLAAPAETAPRLDRRLNGQTVYVCGERGKFYGVVYHPFGKGEDCGVTSPIGRKAPYRGPCKSGWMDQVAVDVVAD